MCKQLLIVLVAWMITSTVYAQQLDISAEIRPRFESRHGYNKLIEPSQNAANFVSQRTRLNVNFSKDKITLGMTIQNVRTWGDVGTLAKDDTGIAFHEAWAQFQFNKSTAAKFGRQEIAYDDERIFGAVGWAQSARSHDALILKITPNTNHQIDLGLAYNSDGAFLTDSLYSNVAGYKTFQYGWYHGKFNRFGLSFLILNTGVEYLDNPGLPNEEITMDFFQTIGPRLTYKKDKVAANAAAYVQTGKIRNSDVMTAYFDANFMYRAHKNFTAGIGGVYMSGKDMTSTNADVESFNPIFGTNHKFNGWMDYFYVGNHANSVGLIDLNATFVYTKNKFEAKVIPHFFQSDGVVINDMGDKMDKDLGTEIDFTASYKIAPYANVKVGYSQMLATQSMEALKGGDKDESNHWAWVMVTIKPQLFSSKPKENK